MDGELAEIEEPFSNGLMFPKDSDGAPAEVYNCRCTMRTVIKGINDEPVETYAGWIQRMIDEGYAPQTDWQKERFGDYDKAIERWKQRKGTQAPDKPSDSTRVPKVKQQEPTKQDKSINSTQVDNNIVESKTIIEYKQIGEEEFLGMQHTITKEERKIIYGKGHFSGYVNSSEAKHLNKAIRNGEPLTTEQQKVKDTLTSIIERNTMPINVKAVRYVNADALENIIGIKIPSPKLLESKEDYYSKVTNLLQGVKKGYVDKEHNFLSVSLVEDKNVMQRKAVEMRINIPEGINCYITTNKKESEVIFGIDTELELENVTFDNTQIPWKYVVEYTMRKK